MGKKQDCLNESPKDKAGGDWKKKLAIPVPGILLP